MLSERFQQQSLMFLVALLEETEEVLQTEPTTAKQERLMMAEVLGCPVLQWAPGTGAERRQQELAELNWISRL